MTIPVTIEINHPDLLVGGVDAINVPSGPADASLATEIDNALKRRSAVGPPTGRVKSAIRDMLRVGATSRQDAASLRVSISPRLRLAANSLGSVTSWMR